MILRGKGRDTSSQPPRAIRPAFWLVLFLLFSRPDAAGAGTVPFGQLLDATGAHGGLVVVIGCREAGILAEPVRQGRFLVFGLDRDRGTVAAARKATEPQNGAVTVAVWRGNTVPVVDNAVTLLVVRAGHAMERTEALRVLRPGGVVWWETDGRQERKKRPENIDTWTHYLHDAAGNAVARDEQVGPPRAMQWLAAPLWTRNHHALNSVSAMVADAARIYTVQDNAPSASLKVPARWRVTARDAFNGKLLWEHAIDSWADWRGPFRSGPVELARLLVAGGGNVYVPLALGAPVSALDGASGRLVRTYPATRGAEEILWDRNTLLVVVGSPFAAQSVFHARRRGRRSAADGKAAADYRRSLIAFNADSATRLWEWSGKPGETGPTPLTSAMDPERVCFQLGNGVVCLDRRTGVEKWRTPHAGVGRRHGPILTTPSTLVLHRNVVLWADGKKVTALDAADGRELWRAPIRAGFRSPCDVFVIDGLVWTGPDFAVGRELRTGRKAKAQSILGGLQTLGHHHRCYREKATSRFIIAGKRGFEFVDLLGTDDSRNNWVRGTCQYGILPCNGLIYAPPHCCGCYMEAKLYGAWALSAQTRKGLRPSPVERLERGSASGSATTDKGRPEDWPTYRHDPLRSGNATTPVSDRLKTVWIVNAGGRLSAPVAAAGTVVVSDVDAQRVIALDADTGAVRWTFRTGGRVDSPPTLYAGTAIFGCADGSVYCVRLDDGRLIWRFLAAPSDLRTVALERVESVRPVHGSVLVQNGTAYFAVGRSSYLDGGILLYGLDARSGAIRYRTVAAGKHFTGPGVSKEEADQVRPYKLTQNAVDARTLLAPDKADAFSMAGGVTSDVLVSNGADLFLRWQRYDTRLRRRSGRGRHLFSTSSLLDGADVHRSHWVLGTGDFGRIPVAYSWIVNRKNPTPRFGCEPVAVFGLLLTFDDAAVFGISRVNGYQGYEIFRGPNRPLTAVPDPPPDFHTVHKGAPRLDYRARWKWHVRLDLRPRALIKAGNRLFLAGMPDRLGRGDAESIAVFEGRGGGLVRSLDPATGKTVSETKLAAPPVWNGLAAARGRLLVSCMNGTVVCLGPR
ncbi:MAG: PQQ-binding-like beta-propeller repeat protein [Kiritimatiellaeota bacterium]|nr:PQQ-binding-like beta-propeller repeat protein [Kiritimatiellota bacterium]